MTPSDIDLAEVFNTHGELAGSTLYKARDYAARGRVGDIGLAGNGRDLKVSADVKGSQRTPYHVEILFPGTIVGMTATCTCPLREYCKHIAAVLLKAFGDIADAGPKRFTPFRNVSPPPPPPPPKVVLNQALTAWLARVNTAPRPPRATPTVENPTRVLIYVLASPRFAGYGVSVIPMRVLLKKDGSFGKVSRLVDHVMIQEMVEDPTGGPDSDILRALAPTQGYEPRLKGAYGARILEMIVRTGRAHWTVFSATPLQLHDPRPATLGWRQLPDGQQKATLIASPPAEVVLPLIPPWYVDPSSHTCGPLQTDGDHAQVKSWLDAPLVSPEDSSLLASAIATSAMPRPRALDVRKITPAAPTPVLHLSQVTFAKPATVELEDSWRKTTISKIDLARLSFDYDGLRITADDPSPFLTRITGDVVERIARDNNAEERADRDLLDAGFCTADHYFSCAEPPEVENALIMERAEDWPRFITEFMPAAQVEGWRFEFDPSFSFRPATIDAWYSNTTADGSIHDWFSYELGITVEGKPVNLLPMLPRILALLRRPTEGTTPLDHINLVITDGRLVQLPVDRLRAIAETLVELFDPTAMTNGRIGVSRLRAAELIDLGGQKTWRGPEELKQLAIRLAGFSGIPTVAPPATLQATLRPYQLEGLSWLQFLRDHQFAGILADDMGLGKTLQALAHIVAEKEAGRLTSPALVIAPTSLMGNWRNEAAKFAPQLKTLVLHGSGRKARFDDIPSHDLLITSYPLLPRDIDVLGKQPYHLLILDEAQYIKNPRAKWSEAIRSLSASHRLCLTGTPMENHLGELWSLMHFLSPGYLGSEKQFRKIYRDPIEKHGDSGRRTALARRIRPFIMRRKKEDVARELPPKTEIVRSIELDGPQRDLYETIRLAMHEKVQAEIAAKGLARSHIVILEALLKLRQVCCDPQLVKLERAKQVKGSAKLELLADMLPELVAEGKKVLLFSQFTTMLDLIERTVNDLKIPFVRLDGSTANREKPVNAFQNGDVPLFLISLKAGGTGLNLTAADTVIHYDPWWNPAVERQATDRAHRIGQDKNVFVYKLITAGTVEEKILALQEKKKELVAGLLGEGAQENLQLDRDTLKHLFDPLQ